MEIRTVLTLHDKLDKLRKEMSIALAAANVDGSAIQKITLTVEAAQEIQDAIIDAEWLTDAIIDKTEANL